MKKHPAINVTFNGPVALIGQALEAMQALGFERVKEGDGSIFWRDSAHFKDLPFPGAHIAGFRHREGLTQEALSSRTGIPRRHISEMENGKRLIGKNNARKLAKVLNVDSRLLLSA
ncbi:MAG: helix-turn-helix transcriptional regulator [Burkholderiaceae bacterium]|jgi:DNA-binding XRE family transcriptional regulator|nr:helix-turn-helix transcriptional regulator [Burkholderiaceae bacterium]